MKKFILLLCLFVCLTAAGMWAVRAYFFSKGPLVVVKIEPGQSGSSVAQMLKEKGIIRSELFFKILLRLTSSARDLKAGRFDLRENTSAFEVINCIKSGKCTHYEKVTFLEGWRSEEIAEVLAEKGITDARAFLDIVRKNDLEGYLFPSTYLFAENTPAQKVVDEMLAQYKKNIAPLFKKYKTNLTEKQVLTVASIVEREAIVHDERPKIAAVYLNRYRIGKRLEADPTVQYALGFNLKENRYWKKGLTYRDLKISSPYNTYRNAGLPPGPICNPSRESVLGVLNPEPNFDALYFVADSGGRHVFSKTFDEHRRHIKRIRGR
ncbi:endolytic transglycosylase MltG [Candidatus Avelusimicrobium alvi]|uniref:endolytic transglycosylase MltG n=1 Tax=Candidatus Avelusimicrobium alvi TaxID=3416221 RepID=UPI003D10E1FE